MNKIFLEPSMGEEAIYETYEPPRSESKYKRRAWNKNSKYQKNTQKKEIDTLVLWDIENVNFFDDYRTLHNLIDNDKSIKYVVAKDPKEYSSISRLSNTSLYKKLKARNWNIEKPKKKIDEKLMAYFDKHKQNITNLIIITADSDFRPIALEAENLGIDVRVLNNNRHTGWYNNFNYQRIGIS